ncbi:hypothetical protein V6C27_01130 [Peptococcaceae bacterium 1198_IL3148]
MADLKTKQSEPVITAEASYQDEWYDLLPVEKKLIKYSLGLGIGLLVVFVLIFKVF